MILGLALAAAALQGLVPAATMSGRPTTLSVRAAGAEHGSRVPLIVRPNGALVVRADALTAALGGLTRRLANGHYAVTVPGVTIEMADGSGFATSSAGVIPLPAPASVDGGALYLPLAVVTDVLPRLGTGVLYDSSRVELRLFTPLIGTSHHAVAERRRRAVADVGPDVGLGDAGESRRTLTVASAPNDYAGPPSVAPSGDVLLPDDDAPIAGEEATVLARRHLVVVDAGHGGPDHGMMGPLNLRTTLYEKNITLAVALKVGAALRRHGIDVVQTRTRDTLIALSDRGRIANEHHGDLFLSIHVNAANPNWHEPAAARGFETYFLAEAKTEDARRVERMENEAVRFETGANASDRDPLNFIIDDMHQNEHLRESSDLAETIQHRLGQMHPGPDRGVKQAGFRVLVTAFMPAVLVEIGFGTNASEARFLSDPSSQSKIAAAIAGATADYLARYERRVSTAAE
jgi:N-acetylmuramoyl-L-alanine amidase